MATFHGLVRWINKKKKSVDTDQSVQPTAQRPPVAGPERPLRNSALNRSLPAIPDVASEVCDFPRPRDADSESSHLYEEITPVDNLFMTVDKMGRFRNMDVDLSMATEIGPYLVVPIVRCHEDSTEQSRSKSMRTSSNEIGETPCECVKTSGSRNCLGNRDINNDEITTHPCGGHRCHAAEQCKCNQNGGQFNGGDPHPWRSEPRHAPQDRISERDTDNIGPRQSSGAEGIYSTVPPCTGGASHVVGRVGRHPGGASGRSLPRGSLSMLGLPTHVRSEIDELFTSPPSSRSNSPRVDGERPSTRDTIDDSDLSERLDDSDLSERLAMQTILENIDSEYGSDDEVQRFHSNTNHHHGDPEYIYYLDKVKHHLSLKERVKKIIEDTQCPDTGSCNHSKSNSMATNYSDAVSLATTHSSSTDSGHYTDTLAALDLSELDDCNSLYYSSQAELAEIFKDPNLNGRAGSGSQTPPGVGQQTVSTVQRCLDGGGRLSCRATTTPKLVDKLSCRATNYSPNLSRKNVAKTVTKKTPPSASRVKEVTRPDVTSEAVPTPERQKTTSPSGKTEPLGAKAVRMSRNRLLGEMSRVNHDRQLFVV